MDNGWIKIHRSILSWEWWDDRNTRDLFIYCLLMANHEDKKWHGKTVERGSFVTSLQALAAGSGLTVQNVRTSLEHLKSTHELTSQSTREFTTITICKYEQYQVNDSDDQQTNQQTFQQTTNKQLTHDQEKEKKNPPITPYKENKKNLDINVEEQEGKNNNLSLSNARVREGGDAGLGVMMAVDDLLQEVLQECDNGSMGMSSMCRLYGLQLPQVKEAATIFADKLKADGTTWKARGDFRHHFNSWLKLNVKQIFFNDNGKQQGVTDDFIIRTAASVAANGGLAF